MKSVKIKIDPENKKAVEALEEGLTTILSMNVVLHNGGLGLKFNCNSSMAKAFDKFMPEGWLMRFMERLAAVVADNKKMYKLMRDATHEMDAGFDAHRLDLEKSNG